MSSIKISVVIATCNRVHLLKNCIRSLEQQSLDKDLFEVIVVNDGSTDSTKQLLEDFKKKTRINFNYINQENRGVSSARNTGIDNARGDYVAFTDDDCIVPEGWLAKMYQLFNMVGGNVAGIGGPLDCVTRQQDSYIANFIQFVDEFNYIPVLKKYFIWYVHTSRLKGTEQVPYLRTSNAIFRKKCLKEIEGFDVNFKRPGGEDPDLCYRLLNKGYRFHFDKDLVVLHNSRERFTEYFKSLRNYIKGEVRKSRKRHLYKNSMVRRSYQFIISQKLVGIFLSFCKYPLSVIKMFKEKRYSCLESITFPLIILASKIYALAVALFFHVKHMKKTIFLLL